MKNRYEKRRDLAVELPSANGHEQTGTRPAMVLAETEANIAVIIPFTTNLQALRFPHTIEIKPSTKNGLSVVSVGLIFQVRAVDKKRLRNKIGELGEPLLSSVNAILRELLSL